MAPYQSRSAKRRYAPTGCIAALALILFITALAEHFAGRSWLCPCGRLTLWAGSVHGPENSQMIADWYSLSHIIHGLLFYGALWIGARRWPVGWRLVVATAIEAGWELLENSPIIIDRYRAVTLAWGYAGDSIINSISDIGFMMLGFAIARKLPVWGSVVLGLALELIALAVIRDNLTLNVLMLIHPIDAIRVWQGQ